MEKLTTDERLLQALQVTAELTQTEFSREAILVMMHDLAIYPLSQVLSALHRCRKELKRGQLTLGAIMERLDDGRPGPEEAWSMIPRDEHATVVWCDEMAEAYQVAAPLLADGDRVAARMAFLERYRALLQRARDAGSPARWWPSLGHDPRGREAVLQQAVALGRLDAEQVAALLPPPRHAAPALPAEEKGDSNVKREGIAALLRFLGRRT
jgi:hypothetical protein